MIKTTGKRPIKRGEEVFTLSGPIKEIRIPKIGDLSQRLHFNSADGRIWLDDSRMLLMHATAFGTLRQELIDSIGTESARSLLTRVGYVSGARDATTAWKARHASSEIDLLIAGGQLHALQGIARVEPVKVDIDSASGRCYIEFLWRHSIEVEVAGDGAKTEPSCWMEVGYSSGFLSALMGKRILAREIECGAMGAPCCRVIAQPIEAWDNPELDLKYLDPIPAQPRPKTAPQPATGKPDSDGGSPRHPHAKETGIVGASAAFNTAMHKIERVARTSATVLLLGESGVGKSVFARTVHARSKRAGGPMIEVNCAAIPDPLMESELFGVEKGAYSGASEARPGRFEIADGGTIFLDEIGTLSMTAQGKLLRILQTGEMERLGSTRTKKLDVRIVAATNENLQKSIKDGRFREDLFYRLNVFPITIKPLRERKEDIPILLEYMLDKYSTRHERHLSGITSRALQAILSYSWPGNIREFENVIERGVILADDDCALDIMHLFSVDASFETAGLMGLSDAGALISREDLLKDQRPAAQGLVGENLGAWAKSLIKSRAATLEDIEDELVRAALDETQGNVTQAAHILGVSRAQMYYKVKKLTG